MDSGRREQLLRAYGGHARRFDEIAAGPFHTSGMFPHNGPASVPRREPDHLSDRQQQVLSLVAEGFPNQEISLQLEIAPETVKQHVKQIISRLGARNRAHAVSLGFERGLLN